MGKKVLILVGALVTPGGLVALTIAWIATRPDVQMRMKDLWTRAVCWWKGEAVPAPQVVAKVVVLPTRVQVPVSQSRCNATVAFRALRAA